MKIFKLTLKIIAVVVSIFVLLIIGTIIYVFNIPAPNPPITSLNQVQKITIVNDSTHLLGDNWYQKNDYGLFEMKVSGNPYELGQKHGILAKEQVHNQEEAFTKQIKSMIPNHAYLKFVRYIVRLMNKNLEDFVSEEYKLEIKGISESASDEFQWIGTNYERILNYHAAHDIGHALQNLMLVGCTSFGAWGNATEDGSMLIGRNFDFWVGDDFSKEKIVAFYQPEKGYRFAFVTWGAFTGVVSGMNMEGLTVTINAAKSQIPWQGAATPVSLVAREILQYAKNIDEAISIAKSRKMFVSESFLVGSAKDKSAIIIEKTPDTLAVYQPKDNTILCTNHYQSQLFENQELNRTQKQNSASVYRYTRLQELMNQTGQLNQTKVANILRDRKGIRGEDIGNGNEKAINQLIAHHSIIFQPDSLKMWVSTSPFQLGAFLCYDLKKVFNTKQLVSGQKLYEPNQTIAADSFIQEGYTAFNVFRNEKLKWLAGLDIDTNMLLKNNQLYYDAWRIAGDFASKKGWKDRAMAFYQQALKLEIATIDEKKSIEKKIKDLNHSQ